MPRLSVDIDLTYLPLDDFATALSNIEQALFRIKNNLNKMLPGVRISDEGKRSKLFISARGVLVKVEVNTTGRGSIYEPVMIDLCQKAQDEFDYFVSMRLLPPGQILGSKICAALDRQHPRDLFDVQYILNDTGITQEIKEGFLFYLLSHERPLHELLSPNWKDQKQAMETQFAGMTADAFTYELYEQTKENLLNTLHNSLTKTDKQFLLEFKSLQPDWSIYDFQQFPGIKWKLENLKKLKEMNPEKHQGQLGLLRQSLLK
jgi:hypothetical protein